MITIDARSRFSDAVGEFNATRLPTALDVLVTSGAIAKLGSDPRPLLVGDLLWIDETEVLFFTAHGDALTDAHRLTFDDAVVKSCESVTFLRDNHVVAVLQRIDDADVDDREDFRSAWQLWLEVAALRRGFIDRCFASIESSTRATSG